jgi:hypothetical protein
VVETGTAENFADVSKVVDLPANYLGEMPKNFSSYKLPSVMSRNIIKYRKKAAISSSYV